MKLQAKGERGKGKGERLKAKGLNFEPCPFDLVPLTFNLAPPITWTNAYIDIPFLYDGRDKAGVDCWGLVWMVYMDQLGILLPDYRGMFTDGSVATMLRRAKMMDKERALWERRSPYESPQPFDVVLLRTKGVPSHVGVVIDSRRMLHITEGINSCVEDYAGLLWKDRVIGFYWRAHE